jgi:hypothetical protein
MCHVCNRITTMDRKVENMLGRFDTERRNFDRDSVKVDKADSKAEGFEVWILLPALKISLLCLRVEIA